MKVQIEKDVLVRALDKMVDVSTKALVPDFNETGRVTIEVKPNKILFTSTNGHLIANLEVNTGFSIKEVGKATTDSVKLRDSVKRIVTESVSSLIEISDKNEVFIASDSSGKRKKLVKLPTYSHHKKIEIRKPADSDSRFFETDHFIKGVRSVSPFQWGKGYKLHYQCVLFHWLEKETRFVCGDGAIFAIMTMPKNPKETTKKEVKRLAQVDQLLVITSIIEDSKEVELCWGKDHIIYIKADNGLELVLKGTPQVQYIAYDNNAFRFDEAKAFVDVEVKMLKEVADLIGVLRDEERISQGKTHATLFEASSDNSNLLFKVTNKQGKFQCEYEIPAQYYNVKDQAKFSSTYAHLFLDRLVHSADHEHLRFYLIEEDGVCNVKDVDLLDSKDDNGVPLIKENQDDCKLTYFFAAISETDEMGENE